MNKCTGRLLCIKSEALFREGYMLNFIWAFMIFIGVVTGLLLGRTKEISDAVLASCVDSIELVITMMGAMCLWSVL